MLGMALFVVLVHSIICSVGVSMFNRCLIDALVESFLECDGASLMCGIVEVPLLSPLIFQ